MDHTSHECIVEAQLLTTNLATLFPSKHESDSCDVNSQLAKEHSYCTGMRRSLTYLHTSTLIKIKSKLKYTRIVNHTNTTAVAPTPSHR